jgi:filamentous hemagglutinin family protein
MSRPREASLLRPRLIAVSVAACFSLAPALGLANPTGPTVVSGSASFAANGSLFTVTNSANAIINWQGFSIGVNEITRFIQPSALSAVLNRVVGSGGVVPQSLIHGVLSSNGHVYLLNPSGVVIGATARIDVAGLVASSLNLSNEDFLAGRLRFTEIPGAGGVANHGVIETPSGGRVFLVAPDVQNTGIVRSPQGEIVLAAGRQVELLSESNPYVTVKVAADAEQAVNVGSLVSDSGRIGMYGALVRHSGVAEANGAVVDAGGNIRFVATKDVNVEAGSRVAANGSSGGSVLLQAEGGTNLVAGSVEATGSSGAGGTVQALGLRVGVVGNGVIDASGETGGGTVLVGGDYRGGNPAVQNAERAYVGADGVIRADARASGNGGRVIVWADGDTRFHGTISARGGSHSGDGGFVETSGKQQLVVTGSVDTRAPNGRDGTWLLDPDDIDIVAGSADPGLSNGYFFQDPIDGNASQIGAATIVNAMETNGLIDLVADNDINFLASIAATSGDFYASAGRHINLGSQTITTGSTVQLNADSNYDGVGSITSTLPGSMTQIRAPGGYVYLQGATVTVAGIDVSGTAGSGMSGGSVYISTTTDFETFGPGAVVTGPINASGASATGQSSVSTAGYTQHVGESGGSGGYVQIYDTASITTGAINARGGDGASSTANLNITDTGSHTVYVFGGSGGSGGSVYLSATGPVVVNGPIDTSSGAGGNAGNASLSITASGSSVYAYISAEGGSGGHAGSPNISGGTVSVQSVLSHGRPGGRGGSGSITVGGTPSYVDAYVYAYGGEGGDGDGVYLYASTGTLTIGGPLELSGARGGDGGMASVNVNVSGAPVYGGAQAGGGNGGHTHSAWLQGNFSMQSLNNRGGDGGLGGTASITVSGSPTDVSVYSDAGGGHGDSGSPVNIYSTGHVSAGDINTSGGSGARGGSATATVSGATGTSYTYASAYAGGGDGGEGGRVTIESTSPASIAVANIFTLGGSGAAGGSAVVSIAASSSPSVSAYSDASGGSGFYGGSVNLYTPGSVTTGSIVTFGGSGAPGGSATTTVSGGTGTVYASAYAGGGSADVGCCGFNTSGGGVFIEADGSISTGPILTSGGAGAPGGSATSTINGSATSGSAWADARGGRYYGGGPVFLSSTNGSISTGIIISTAGSGGMGGTAAARVIGTPGALGADADARGGGAGFGYGGAAYGGGIVSLYASNGSIATGPIFTLGGVGANAGTASGRNDHASSSLSFDTQGGSGSPGGSIFMQAGGSIVTGALLSGGGPGGNATNGVIEAFGGPAGSLYLNAEGGFAGDGGDVIFFANSGSISTGIVNTAGGIAGTAGQGGGDGAWGGHGGDVFLAVGSETGQVTVGPRAVPGVFLNAIFASGGHGGAGGAAASPAGNGGAGGDGGDVELVAPILTINGKIITDGGNAGPGGAGNAVEPPGSQGPGGHGGDVTLLGLSPTSVTFWNAGFNLGGSVLNAGGAGNPPGTAGTTFLDGTAQFLFAEVPIEVVNALFTDLIPPPPEVTQDEAKSESNEEKERKARMAICRPRT